MSELVVRAASRGAVVVSGKDRIPWLNGLLTCDLAKLEPGQAAYGLLVEKKGRIQSDVVLVPARSGDRLALFVPAELRDSVLATLDHYLIMEDAELAPDDLVLFHIHGRRADVPDAPFAGTLDLLGSGGVVLAAPRADADALEVKLGGAIDEATFGAFAIERGLPRFGVEFDGTAYPQEAGIEKIAVSFSKGCYLGQEVVYMLENRGHVKRKLVPLDVEGDAPPAVGAAVTTATGEAVGEVKSATMGPTTHRPVAIAYVKWAHAKPDTALVVGDRAAKVRAFP